MASQSLARALAASAVLVAGALVLVMRAPRETTPIAPVEEVAAPPRFELAASDGAGSETSIEAQAAAKIRELEAMSETFRNTTFLIAIRDAGFVCHELLRVYGGLDDSPKWLATCSDMLSYTVGVTSTGALLVAPTLQYMDGIPWTVQPIQPGDERVVPSPDRRPQRLPER